MVKMYMNMSIEIILKIIKQYSSPSNTALQMRWKTFGACLNIHRGFEPCVWIFLPFRGVCIWYDDNTDINTNDKDEI